MDSTNNTSDKAQKASHPLYTTFVYWLCNFQWTKVKTQQDYENSIK